MLGKTAGGIYWLFRYLERAENIARLVETGHRFTLTRGAGSASEWRSIVKALGMDAAYVARHGEYESGHVVNFLLRDKGNNASLRGVIDLARQNARLTRTALTREVWEAVNESWINVNDALKRPVREAELPSILESIKRDSAMVRGAMQNTMLRNDGYNFARIGNFIERPITPRACSTSNITSCCRRFHSLARRSTTCSGKQSCALLRPSASIAGFTPVVRPRLALPNF